MGEKVRADVYLCKSPPKIPYLKENGQFTSAVFKEKSRGNGTSVDRSGTRCEKDTIDDFIKRKTIDDFAAFAIMQTANYFLKWSGFIHHDRK